VRFFTPLPFHPFEVQKLFDNADSKQVSIVAHVLPEQNKVLLKGTEVLHTMRACLKAYRGKPQDPRYEWVIKVFTVSTAPPDVWPVGKLNDLPIAITDKAAGVRSRAATSSEEAPDVTVSKWRCTALRELNLSLCELIAVPRGLGSQFHPQELMLPEPEAKGLLRTLAKAIKDGTGFQMELSAIGDERPLSLAFAHDGTAAFAIFSLNGSDNTPEHMHALLALLPRQKPADDVRDIDHIKKFACLKEIPDRAFTQAMADIEPIAAIFFADIGSANYPPVYTAIKVLIAAFFATPATFVTPPAGGVA
jgi:hypothetical protein